MGVIIFYQKFISPGIPARCRFYPTCSQYSLESFEKFSFFKGLWYSVIRIIKCHPLNRGGFDPLPSEQPNVKK
jgi:putative membrane protein insertion efficiency factor